MLALDWMQVSGLGMEDFLTCKAKANHAHRMAYELHYGVKPKYCVLSSL